MKAPTQLVSESPLDSNLDALISNGGHADRRDDFAEYMWMEDMESFDKQVLAELEEEEEIEQCMAEMLAEEEARDTTYYDHHDQLLDDVNEDEPLHRPLDSLADGFAHLVVEEEADHILHGSRLNPYAEEFVPSKNGNCNASSDSFDMSEASDR